MQCNSLCYNVLCCAAMGRNMFFMKRSRMSCSIVMACQSMPCHAMHVRIHPCVHASLHACVDVAEVRAAAAPPVATRSGGLRRWRLSQRRPRATRPPARPQLRRRCSRNHGLVLHRAPRRPRPHRRPGVCAATLRDGQHVLGCGRISVPPASMGDPLAGSADLLLVGVHGVVGGELEGRA